MAKERELNLQGLDAKGNSALKMTRLFQLFHVNPLTRTTTNPDPLATATVETTVADKQTHQI
jgi:hypothetical protein